jgi:hypothetical protein
VLASSPRRIPIRTRSTHPTDTKDPSALESPPTGHHQPALHSVVGMNDPAGLGARELTDTMRAPPAAASARCMLVASAK